MRCDMSLHETINRLKATRYSVEADDLDALSEGLSQSGEAEGLCLEIAEAAVEHELQAKAVADRIAELMERKARFLRTADSLRSIVLQCMKIGGKGSITPPTLTLSVTRRGGDLVVTDESLVPSRYFKPQPPVLDKKALKEA